MLYDPSFQQLPVLQELGGAGFHGIGICGLDPRDLGDQDRVRRDQPFDVLPIWAGLAVLHPADLLQQDGEGHRVPHDLEGGPVFQLLIPEDGDLLVHDFQRDALRLGILPVPVEPRVPVHHVVQVPLRLIGRRAHPDLGGL